MAPTRSTQQAAQATIGTLCWHVHHDKLVEVLTEPLANRIAYIKRKKSARERALRLLLIKRVRGKLPVGLVKTWAAYDKARAACDKAWAAYEAAYDKTRAAYDKARAAYEARAAYVKAWAAYDKAIQNNMPIILMLHAKECPSCPWDGETIFPEAQS